MKDAIKKTIILVSLGIGGFTLINLNLKINITNKASQPDSEATDNDKYDEGLEFMERKKYEDAINSFVSISSDYSKINEVKNVLLKCLILYTNDIHQKVDELVSNPNSDATSYTDAINLINGGLEYIDKLSEKEGVSSDKLNSDYTYVQMLVKIYKYRKNKEPFKALSIYNENENVFIQHPSFIDFKNPIIEECRKEINNIINEYYYTKNYIGIIDYINGLDEEFINSYQSHKKNAESRLLNETKKEISEYVNEQEYLKAKQCVDNYYEYLKDCEEFVEIYNQWFNYSDSKLIYKKITDKSNIKKEPAFTIDGNKYTEVIVLSKYNDESSIEFSLDKNYSKVEATIFLTNYRYSLSKEYAPLDILITDDQGNILNKYSNLTYKNSINISSNISNVNYLRFTIKGKNNNVKIGIRNGILY